MFYTGLRPGEDIEIKTSDLKSNYINVTKTISSHKKREIGIPKTFSSMHKVKISRFLVKDLKKIIKNYKKGDGNLFLFKGIKPLSPTSIKRRKVSACKKKLENYNVTSV